MKLALKCRQIRLPLDAKALERLAMFLAARAAGARPLGEIVVLLADHALMARANREHMGRNSVTDVISFPLRPMPHEDPDVFCGDMIVNAELAATEGPARNGAAHELALYIAHGLNHISGASDATPSGARSMRRRELAWLAEAAGAGLIVVAPRHKHARARKTKKQPKSSSLRNANAQPVFARRMRIARRTRAQKPCRETRDATHQMR